MTGLHPPRIANAKSGSSGGIFDEARRGWLAEIPAGSACAGAYRDNEWNAVKVVANGASLRTWINGRACAEVTDTMDKRGFVALQVHEYKGPAPLQVRFRNIRLQELP